MPKPKKNDGKAFATKKCPNCFVHIPVDSTQCFSCNKKVGKVNRHGMAKKPIDWLAYVICVLSWAVFGFYIWWAFLKK